MYALKAIETKYHPATNLHGSRHSARAEGGHRIMVDVLVNVPDLFDSSGVRAFVVAVQS